MLLNILITILLLGLIIFLHELGHFMTAKYFKMPVIEFAIGMGPKIFSKKIKETSYSLRVFPIGGFVNIDGMQIDDENPVENGFNTQPTLNRFIVLIAGVVMNFLSALVVIFMIISLYGNVPARFISNEIEKVSENSNAYNKIMPNDKIVKINNIKINNFEEFATEITKIGTKNYNNEDVNIKLDRNGKILEEKIKLIYSKETQTYIMGVQMKPPTNITLIDKFKISVYTFNNYFKMMVDGLILLVSGKVSTDQLTGPIGLPKVVGQAVVSAGYSALLGLFVLLSINIGLMNLLPIPALDGGRLIFVFLEFLKIKVNKKIEEKLHMVGMIFLLILMVFIVFNDVKKF